MRIGLQLFASRRDGETAADAFARLIEQAQLGEELGYDIVWLAEHHGTDWNLCTDPLTLAAHLAAATTTIRLGTAVVNLGLHHPIELAERAAMVNVLADGRLELGLGKGFSPLDYQRYGLDQAEQASIFTAHLRALHDDLRRQPETAQVPLWLATTGSASTLDLAADLDLGLLLAASSGKLMEIITGFRQQSASGRIGVTRLVHIAGSDETAWSELKPFLEWYRAQLGELQPGTDPPTLAEVARDLCIFGPAQACAEETDRLGRKHGLTDFIGVVGIGGMEHVPFERTARQLIGRLRSILSVRPGPPIGRTR